MAVTGYQDRMQAPEAGEYAARVIRSWGAGPRGTIITGLHPARVEHLLRLGMIELVPAEDAEPPAGKRARR